MDKILERYSWNYGTFDKTFTIWRYLISGKFLSLGHKIGRVGLAKKNEEIFNVWLNSSKF